MKKGRQRSQLRYVCLVQGLVPNEREQVELGAMYAPFLNLPVHDEETYDRIFNQIYSGDDTGNESS